MGKVNRLMTKAGCFFWSFIYHKKHIRNEEKERKYILLPLFGMIGDSVLFLDALMGYKKLYPEQEGYTIVVGCRGAVKALFKSIGIDDKFEIIELDRKKLQTQKGEFHRSLKRFSKYRYDSIIHIRSYNYIEDCFLYGLDAENKVVFRNNDKVPASRIKKHFHNNTYTKIVYADENSEQYGRFGKLLRELGYTDYKSHVSRMPKLNADAVVDKPYCIICPSASSKSKCWATDRFAALADMIVEKYSLAVCLTGSDADKVYSDAVIGKMKHKEMVYDFTGNTSMNNWFELIRNARIAITNDSASVHIAAAVQTPSVCIAPQHDGYRFLPYKPDEILADDCIPVPVRCEKVSCFDCRRNNKPAAVSNPECMKSIRESGMYKCIAGVKLEQVFAEVEKILD